MNSNFKIQQEDLLMEAARWKSTFTNQQHGGITNGLNFFHSGGAIELEIDKPHQAGPPVSFIFDYTTYASYLNASVDIPFYISQHHIVNPYFYTTSFTPAYTIQIYTQLATCDQLNSLSTQQLATQTMLQGYTSGTTNLPNEVEVQLFDKMLETQYLNSEPAHQVFDKHSERVETAEPNHIGILIPASSLLQDADKNHKEHSYVLLIFYGNDPRDWILKARNYFKLKNKADSDKIRLTGVHFEGRALTLYKWFYETRNEQVD